MTSFLQVLGTHSESITPQLFIGVDRYRCLVNAGEKTQRVCIERGISMTKISDIILTRLSSSSFLGLPGLLLTLEGKDGNPTSLSSGISTGNLPLSPWTSFRGPLDHCRSFKRVTRGSCDVGEGTAIVRIWGPPPLFNLFTALSERIASFRYVNFEIHEILPTDSPQTPITLPHPEAPAIMFHMWCRGSTPSSNSLKRRRIEDPSDSIIDTCALLLRLDFLDRPGKLDMARASQHKIPRGSLLGRLKAGQSVELPDGRTITHDMVCDPPLPGVTVFIYDSVSLCDSNAYTSWLNRHLTTAESCRPTIQYLLHPLSEGTTHTLAKNVITVECMSPKRQLFLQPFPCYASLFHIFQHLLPDFCAPTLFDSTHEGQEPSVSTPSSYVVFPIANRGFLSHPPQSQEPTKYTIAALEALDLNDQVNMCRELFRGAAQQRYLEDTPQARLAAVCSIQFLGTGAAIPSKYRNVSGIYVHMNHEMLQIGILLDCGEGTLLQLLIYSASIHTFKDTLKHIKVIFISHHHADHHLGLPTVLSTRHRWYPLEQPPLVYGPRFLEPWLQFWNRHIEPCPHTFVCCDDCTTVVVPTHCDSPPFSVHLNVVPVNHTPVGDNGSNATSPPSCYGVCVAFHPLAPQQHQGSLRLVYSGDTRPCHELLQLATHCDLLIHEATFDDSYAQDALSKGHSTFQEALGVARDSQAHFTILTHFSQRYPLIPIINASNPRFIAVMDGLRLPFHVLKGPLSSQSLCEAFHHLSVLLQKLRGS